jgi:phytoene/squalene synthetase
MDRLHHVLSAIRTETKSAKDHTRVFREFISHLDQAQRKPPSRRPRLKAAAVTRRRAAKPAK